MGCVFHRYGVLCTVFLSFIWSNIFTWVLGYRDLLGTWHWNQLKWKLGEYNGKCLPLPLLWPASLPPPRGIAKIVFLSWPNAIILNRRENCNGHTDHISGKSNFACKGNTINDSSCPRFSYLFPAGVEKWGLEMKGNARYPPGVCLELNLQLRVFTLTVWMPSFKSWCLRTE